jgi:phage baseplate assembly protein W
MTIDYGTDISCTLVTETLPFPDGTVRTQQVWDAPDGFPEVSGRAGLVEALLRRLVTPRGQLLGEPDYGTDVRDWINDERSITEGSRLGAAVAAELAKDERVKSASATASFDGTTLTIVITLVDAQGPFKLTLAVDQVDVKVLGVTS